MEALIITQDDISAQYPLSKNLNDDRINPYILRAQQADLKPILGTYFYYEFIEGFTELPTPEVRWVELFEGVVYEWQTGQPEYFNGIKPMLIAFAYARIVDNNSNHVTRGGNVTKSTDESLPVVSAVKNAMNMDAESDAYRYKADLLRFLDKKRTVYPEYGRSPIQGDGWKTGFNFTKV